MKNLIKLSIVAISIIAMSSCTKDEVLVMKKVEEVKPDTVKNSVPIVSGWGEGKGYTNNGEG
ncbi:hypothetical protein D3C87_976700 [compost metagenome]